ncbi:exodeoxyribonuclease V subunit gamma [Rhodanobacter sp. DHG33]|nr:exodeoxyribonuclease V subunit gamma [Rhodanobacter sp. DHG33]
MVVHGNRLEDLRDLLVEWLARAPLAPLEDELMLVQSNGIAQWLKLALARPRDAGGMGISAAVDMQLPGRFLWRAYRAVLGREAVPADSPFDKSRLAWRLMRLLPAQLGDEAFAPLRHFLGEGRVDPARLFQLAQQIADLFDQYQVYRADWLEDWEHGRDVLRDDPRGRRLPLPATQRWQAQLWRALLRDVGTAQRDSHRAGVHRAFLARASALETRPAALPRRIVVFGISSLPQQTLEALTALGRVCQVFLLVANPCRHYWADIIEDRELLKAERHRQTAKPGAPETPQYEELHLHANPLLAAWGKQGRDYIRLLDGFDAPEIYRARFAALNRDIDLFADPGRDSLLHQVQQAILDLEPLPADPAQRQPWKDGDESLRFHVAHNPQREVEILHDELLALFERAAREGRSLAPRDVMVMVPDIQTYAPHVQAVFGRISPDDPRYLPCSIADRPARGSAPLLVALEQLLRLPESRFAAGDILDLLDAPALRRRFHLDEADLPVLRRWIEGAGIRWGLDGAQKETLGLPPEEQNSWRFGLRRMLLGYAVGDGTSLDGIAPYAEVGGLDAALVGPLAALLERLEHWWRLLATPTAPAPWIERLRHLLADMFDAGRDDDDALALQRLDDALAEWGQSCLEAGFDGTLPLSVVREHWLAAIDQSRLSQRFLGGAVSFGTLLPMRAIPFRVVCLLGMNDGDYPRRHDAPDFDLMALPKQQRPGDRSRREDDRYLFLEALLSARDTLHVSWVGRSARDNAELPPSVLVGQLRDYLAAGWRRADDDAHDPKSAEKLLAALTTEYPLQAFSQRYFDATGDARLFTYAGEWQRARQSLSLGKKVSLSAWQPEGALDTGLLQRFLKSPAKTFYAERLGVRFDALDDADAEQEAFALDGLQRHLATDALLRTAIAAGTDTLGPAAQRLREQGSLPPGSFGTLALEPVEQAARDAGTAWHSLDARWPHATGMRELRHEAHGLCIEDWLGDLRDDGEGGHVRLIPTASTLARDDGIHHDKLLDAWVVHLLANANALRLTSRIVGPDATLVLPSLATAEASVLLDELCAALRAGMQSPLPVARKTAFAWLRVEAANQNLPDDKRKHPANAARQNYDQAGHQHGHGEVQDDLCLQREWPDFDALLSAGFEHWLHLYRPLLAAARKDEDAA